MKQTNYITPDIEKWSEFLSPDDYETIVRFVNDSHNGFVWNEMIVLAGDARTGKSTLINAISETFDTNQVSSLNSGSMIFNSNTKIYVVPEDWSNNVIRNIKQILNRDEMCSRELYQPVTSFVPSGNIIGVTNSTPEGIYEHEPSLCNKVHVIRMTHRF